MIIDVVAAIIFKDNKLLIAKRQNDKWEFPGGKIEKGETSEKALERELYEEFEINSKVNDFVCSNEHKYEHIHINLHAYKVEVFDNNFKLLTHKEIKWIKPKDLLKYDLSKADIPIAEHLKNIYE